MIGLNSGIICLVGLIIVILILFVSFSDKKCPCSNNKCRCPHMQGGRCHCMKGGLCPCLKGGVCPCMMKN